MKLMVYEGPGQSGKTQMLQETMIRITEEEPERHIIYLVPEQSTLMVQKSFLDQHPSHSMMNVEILSFRRLAHRILSETGEPAYTLLDDMGKSMLLYKAALDQESELSYYGGSIHKAGFIGQMKIMLTEMYQYCIDEQALDAMIGTMPEESTLRRKLSDIRKLYHAFSERLSEDTIPSEKLLDVLIRSIPQSQLLQGADLFIDGFYGFTPQQYEILRALFGKAHEGAIALTMTDKGDNRWSLQILHKLQELGAELTIQKLDRRERLEDLKLLTDELFGNGPVSGRKAEHIQVLKADQVETEVFWMLSKISELLGKQKYRYQDIAILCADRDHYVPHLKRMAAASGIPLFIDEKTDLSTNPAVRMITSCLNMLLLGFSYDAVFDFIKTGFLPFSKEEMDLFENRALAEGWRGKKRYFEEFTALSENDEEKTAWTRELFEGFERLLSSTTVRECNRTMRSLLEHSGLERTMEERADWFHERGDFVAENVYRQIYKTLGSILDQLDRVLGDETITLKDYRELLNVGFQQSKIGTPPPGTDVIPVIDLERSRSEAVRALFILGFNEEGYPKVSSDNGLLSDMERRKTLALHDMAADNRRKLGEQEFAFYVLLSKVSDHIGISYSTGDTRGHSIRPSRYLKRLEQLFDPMTLYDTAPVESWNLEQLLTDYYRHKFDPQEEQAVNLWLQDHKMGDQIRARKKAEQDKAPEEELEHGEIWDLLDLSQGAVSVSQLEQYARCPFAYYMNYGLRLQERELLQIRPLDNGNVLHDLMKEIGPYLEEAMTDPELEDRVSSMMDQYEEHYGQYQATHQFRFYWKRLKKEALRSVKILREQLRHGQFHPQQYEWSFGERFGRIPPLQLTLEDGRTISLRGKIDRIDILQDEEDRYIRIIDYKSGNTSWELDRFYEGVQLQLPIYMNAYRNSEGGKPAGIFYFHLMPSMTEKEASETEEQILPKESRLNGMALADPYVMERVELDPTKPEVTTVIMNKNGTFRKGSKAIPMPRFEELLAYANKKCAGISESIARGQMAPYPMVRQDGSLECSICSYRAVCRLEPKREADRIHRPEDLEAEDLWQRISDAVNEPSEE